MSQLFFSTVPSPYGDLWTARTAKGLTHLLLSRKHGRPVKPPILQLLDWRDRFAPKLKLTEDPDHFDDLRTWLNAYFAGDVPKQKIPFDFKGTPFQVSVWKVIATIPYGRDVTYGEISRRIGRNAGSARAVGAAVGANPISIVVPCHRVLGERGKLTGYGGGLRMKETLLRLEGNLLL